MWAEAVQITDDLQSLIVGIEQITTGRICSQNGALIVEATSSQFVQVYNVTGKQQYTRTVNGTATIALTPGVYIARADKANSKKHP